MLPQRKRREFSNIDLIDILTRPISFWTTFDEFLYSSYWHILFVPWNTYKQAHWKTSSMFDLQ